MSNALCGNLIKLHLIFAQMKKLILFLSLTLFFVNHANAQNSKKPDAGLCNTLIYDSLKSELLKGDFYFIDSATVMRSLHACPELCKNDTFAYEAYVWAGLLNNPELVRNLFALGLNINAKGKNGDIALHLTCNFGNADAALAMIEKGADINATNKQKLTPLHNAVLRYKGYPIVSALIQAGARVDARDYNNFTPFIASNSFSICDLLLIGGADINAKTVDGYTKMHFAVRDGDTLMVKYLLSKNAAINELDKQGNTPIDYAMRDVKYGVAYLSNQEAIALLRAYGGKTRKELAGNKKNTKK